MIITKLVDCIYIPQFDILGPGAATWLYWFWVGTLFLFFEVFLMPEGTIKKLTDKGFGFIDTGTKQDMFFHMSNVEGTTFDELREGQTVSYVEGHGPKGPRAEKVTPV